MPPRTKTENKQKNPEVDVIKATASTPTKITAVKPKIKKMSPDELVEVKIFTARSFINRRSLALNVSGVIVGM